jgi:branched-chain amino acid transport system substrate-binding protein
MQINFDAIPLFASLSRLDRARLIPNCAVIAFDAGNAIVKQGERGDSLFVLISGSARVVRRQPDGSEVLVARLGQGECFGEVALLTGEQRTADVLAEVTGTTVLKLSRDRFSQLMKQHNDLAQRMARLLAERVSRTTCHVGNGQSTDEQRLLEDMLLPQDSSDKLPSSSGLTAGWSLGMAVRNRRFICIALALLFFAITGPMLYQAGMPLHRVILLELLLGATITWALDAFNYHAVALALPLAAVLFGAATPKEAFAGFSHPSWFLVLGVFAISAAISRTGLMYRLVLMIIARFPASYGWQTCALATSGLLLTPVIPSSNGRAVLSGPLVANLSEILRFRKGSAGSIGMSMAALLGFGHMSFLFMNGTATCLLAFGLLPSEVVGRVTWFSWLTAALVMGLIFFAVSYVTTLLLYRPKRQRNAGPQVVQAQLQALGSMDRNEMITLLVVCASLLGFLTQSWHQINSAWVALASFFLLFSWGVLNDKAVRAEIDWNFLLSFGALVGYGGLISSSGLGSMAAKYLGPLMAGFVGSPYLLLPVISLAMFGLRFVLPLPAAQLVLLLSVLPVIHSTGIDPFVVCLTVLISGNPWFTRYQNSIYVGLMEATEGRLFDHHQTRKAAIAHVLASLAAIIGSIPWWQWLGLIR